MSTLQILPVHHESIFINPSYYQLLFPNPKTWLKLCNEHQTFFGIIAVQNETPIGGVFGIHDHLKQHFQIHAWSVIPTHQNQGIGQRLLRTLETHLAKNKTAQIYLSYREEWTSYPRLQHILSKQGWIQPKISTTLYQLNALAAPPTWINKLSLPAHLTIVNWSSLTESEQSFLNPNQDRHASIATVYSFGLRFQQQLIGGIVSLQVTPNLLQYTHFWIAPHHQQQAYGYYLIQAALKAQQLQRIPQALIQIDQNHSKLMTCLDRHLAPLIQYKSTLRFSTKKWHFADRKAQAMKRSNNVTQPLQQTNYEHNASTSVAA